MHCSNSMRRNVLGVVGLAVVAVLGGCGMSVQHVALPRPASDAPKAWDPIIACAKEQGLSALDVRNDSDPRVRVYIDTNDQLNVVFRTQDGHMDMELQIWGQTTDEDRPKILAKERKIGDAVWVCAQAKMNGAPAVAAPPASGSTTATSPP